MLYSPSFKVTSSLIEYTAMSNVIRHQDAEGTVQTAYLPTKAATLGIRPQQATLNGQPPGGHCRAAYFKKHG